MRRALSGALIVTLLAARAAFAQEVRRELPGFDFTPDGVWRVKARQVRALREQLLSRGDVGRLNTAAALYAPTPGAATAVSGVLRAPLILFRFRDTDTTTQRDTAQYSQAIFAPVPPLARPYTLRTLYEEMSNGLFSVQGRTVSWWTTLDSNESRYVGPSSGCLPYGTCNGVWSGSAFAALQSGLAEAVRKVDPSVDFSEFDSDGDGAVDLVLFVHARKDGACNRQTDPTNNHPWSHRSAIGVTTNDPWPGHSAQFIRVTNYIMQSGLGGASSCDTTQIMAVGTTAHELGHGLGLPDFYDTNQYDGDDSEGIGQWGLMGSGNYTTATSPSYMESFSRSQLGWMTVRPLVASGTYTLGPTTSRDTVMLVRPTAPNPRGEYFLLENRQPVLSDTAMTRIMGPGLLVWHFDSTQYARGFDHNSGPIHALWLMQADGLNQLRSSVQGVRNRGDAGDPYPGSAANTAFAFSSNPAALLNATGNPYGGFLVDSIRQVVAGGEMAFRLRFGGLSIVRASDPTAQVRIRSAPFFVFSDVFNAGDTLTISMDSAQTRADGRARFTFVSWSDGGARTNVLTLPAGGATYTAQVGRAFRLTTAVTGLASPPPGVLRDTFLVDGDSQVLDAAPPPLTLFAGWTGDTSAIDSRIVVRMTRPFTITAAYMPVVLDSVVGQLATGTGLPLNQRAILDAQGNRNGRFDVGDFVAWLDRSGTVVDAATLARALRGARR